MSQDKAPTLLEVAQLVANIGEYRETVEAMANCLRPHEREAFISLFRQDASAAIAAHLERTGQSVTNDAPIPMVLHCPKCGRQHIDAPFKPVPGDGPEWTNPPHRSHLCHGCGHIWRPADVPTTGVPAVQTTGKADSPIATPPEAATAETAGKAPASVPSDARWTKAADRLPACRNEQRYIGINSAGFAGIFNSVVDIAGNVHCMMETPEDAVSIMSDLVLWTEFHEPSDLAAALAAQPRSTT